MTRLLRACSALIAGLVVGPVLAAPAAAADGQDPEDQVAQYAMTVDLAPDGSADVALDLVMDFGSSANHGPYLTYVVKQRFDETQDRIYRMSDVRASSPSGAPADVDTEEDGALMVVRIGDPDTEITGVQTYRITYRVEGWVNPASLTGHGDELNLNVLGGWTMPVHDVRVVLTAPATPDPVSCTTGPRGATTPCRGWSASETTATFMQDEVAPGDGFTVVAVYPTGTFRGAEPLLQDRWAFDRAFAATPLTLGVTTLVALLAGGVLAGVMRRRERQERYVGVVPGLLPGSTSAGTVGFGRRTPLPVQITPPPGLSPGQVGTRIDEHANAQDVTATLIDLAVRGYLRIEQVDGDWRLARRLDAGSKDLLPYERTLYDDVFAGRTVVDLSELRTTFSSSLRKVIKELYADVVARGWFRGDPRTRRAIWVTAGALLVVLGAVLTTLLAIWTSWGLVGLPVVVAGVAVLILSRSAATMTPEGTALLRQAQGFREYLATAQADQLPLGTGEDLFSRYLPYAVAFGLTQRWATVFAGAAARGAQLPVPLWYVGAGYGQAGFWGGAEGFSQDIAGFATTASSAMAAPTPGSSGSSGAGGSFSGGGVSGGGGGSW
ncbi:MAG TPA: DUF2207 domain-containing protein [Propionicimonas sp.]